MKIVADQQIPATKAFSKFADITLCDGREISPADIRDADVLLVRSVTQVNASLLDGSAVKFVATATSGQNHIDLEYLHLNHIGFAHAKGSNAISVAEYVMSSLLVLADQYGFKLKDKTVGVIGCGEAGSRVVDMLRSTGAKVLMNDPPLKDGQGDVPRDAQAVQQYRDLPELLTADILTLHVPLTDEGAYPTRNLINTDVLASLKDDVILLNTSRGGVLDEAALKEHLVSHNDCKVVLDVWENEPAIDCDLLTQIDIGTPHIAGYSSDGKLRATEIIFKAVCKYFSIEVDWGNGWAGSELPESHLSELHLSAEMDDEDAIQMAILASYDVRSDSAALRRLPEISHQQRDLYFDQLRENYPVRREFSSTLITLAESRKVLAEKLKRLGFLVQFEP